MDRFVIKTPTHGQSRNSNVTGSCSNKNKSKQTVSNLQKDTSRSSSLESPSSTSNSNVNVRKVDRFVVKTAAHHQSPRNSNVISLCSNKKESNQTVSNLKMDTSSREDTSSTSNSHINEKSSTESGSDENYLNKTDKEIPAKRKKKSYRQNYVQSWETKFAWLSKRNNSSYCKPCRLYIRGGISHLERHEMSAGHQKTVKGLKFTANLTEFVKTDEEFILAQKVKEAEFKVCSFFVEHNLPFKLMDHMTQLISQTFTDSQIAKKFACSRTKATGMVHLMKSESKSLLINDLKKYKFSLLVDETTDISTTKSLAIVARYTKDDCKVYDRFIALLEVKSSSAEDLYLAIKNFFEREELPTQNFVGFAADHASVMMGQYNGLQAKLKQLNSNLCVIGCSCHSFHTAASKACSVLPSGLEELIKDICSYFAYSAKRISEFQEFQDFTKSCHHKMLKLCLTRWLSLQNVVSRILEQWEPITLYFTSEASSEKNQKAKKILDGLREPVFHLYLLFLNYILKFVNDLNVEFQSESPKIYYLLPRVKELYGTILRGFIKGHILKKYINIIETINVADPSNFLAIEELYVGAKAENKIATSNIDETSITSFKRRILDFYVTLAKEIKLRFDFSSPLLKFASKFAPNVIKENKARSISEAVLLFPDIQIDVEDLNSEYRSLTQNEEIMSLDDEHFWPRICQLKNGLNMQMYPNLCKVANTILALPHSSATCERIFSQLSMIKTKQRNCLLIKTCDALLSAKELLRNFNCNCYSWKPEASLLTKNWKNSCDQYLEELVIKSD